MSGEIAGYEPTDDAGSDTAGRYCHQYELAVRPFLAMLAGEPVRQVLCEWHEDFVVIRSNQRAELMSVKHLEKSQERWTLRDLCGQGGLAHLSLLDSGQ